MNLLLQYNETLEQFELLCDDCRKEDTLEVLPGGFLNCNNPESSQFGEGVICHLRDEKNDHSIWNKNSVLLGKVFEKDGFRVISKRFKHQISSLLCELPKVHETFCPDQECGGKMKEFIEEHKLVCHKFGLGLLESLKP